MASSISIYLDQAMADSGGNAYYALALAMDGFCLLAPAQCQTAAAVHLNLPDAVAGSFADAAGKICADVGSYLPAACYQYQSGQFVAAPLAVASVAPTYRPRDPGGLDASRPTLTASTPIGGTSPAASVPEASALWLALAGVVALTILRGITRRI